MSTSAAPVRDGSRGKDQGEARLARRTIFSGFLAPRPGRNRGRKPLLCARQPDDEFRSARHTVYLDLTIVRPHDSVHNRQAQPRTTAKPGA